MDVEVGKRMLGARFRSRILGFVPGIVGEARAVGGCLHGVGV
jgi:hypothetical protein